MVMVIAYRSFNSYYVDLYDIYTVTLCRETSESDCSDDDASDSDDESLEDDDSGDDEDVVNDECGLSDDDEVCDNGGDLIYLKVPISARSSPT
jgi:hypothetical protein